MRHESELWPERRWGIQRKSMSLPASAVEAKPFKSEAERDAWVKQSPAMRQAVGKRHPAVKALRQHWENMPPLRPSSLPDELTYYRQWGMP